MCASFCHLGFDQSEFWRFCRLRRPTMHQHTNFNKTGQCKAELLMIQSLHIILGKITAPFPQSAVDGTTSNLGRTKDNHQSSQCTSKVIGVENRGQILNFFTPLPLQTVQEWWAKCLSEQNTFNLGSKLLIYFWWGAAAWTVRLNACW